MQYAQNSGDLVCGIETRPGEALTFASNVDKLPRWSLKAQENSRCRLGQVFQRIASPLNACLASRRTTPEQDPQNRLAT
jgi:hypothetical protein